MFSFEMIIQWLSDDSDCSGKKISSHISKYAIDTDWGPGAIPLRNSDSLYGVINVSQDVDFKNNKVLAIRLYIDLKSEADLERAKNKVLRILDLPNNCEDRLDIKWLRPDQTPI